MIRSWYVSPQIAEKRAVSLRAAADARPMRDAEWLFLDREAKAYEALAPRGGLLVSHPGGHVTAQVD